MNRFNYNSVRAKKARVSKITQNKFFKFCILLLFILTIIGGLLIVFLSQNKLGWILSGLSGPFFVVYYWSKIELTHVPNGSNGDINALLSTTCLKLMPSNPNPIDIIDVAKQTRSGKFLLSRLNISVDFFVSIAKQLGDNSEAIFTKAIEIREKTFSEQVGGGVLLIAILECFVDYEDALRELRLDIDDVYQTEIWFNHIHGLVKDEKKPRHNGGIGRDLAFGYTPLLQHYAINISQQRQNQPRTLVPQGNRTDTIEQMIKIFSKDGNQNITIVGPDGSGRTTLVYAFAELLLDADSKISNNLKFRQVFSLDASALIGSAGGKGELEALTTKIFNEAYLAKNIILCLDNAHLFFEEGVGSVDISNVILPILEAGRIRVILVMNEQKYLEISAKNSSLANILNKIVINPSNKETTLKMLQDQTPLMEYQYDVLFTYQSLIVAYDLSQRYIHDIEMPGKAKQLLVAASRYAVNGKVTADSVVEAIERTKGVKIQAAKTSDDKEKLLNLEDLIHERMIDQVDAVKTISNALRRSATSIRNNNRPIGTFLFLGPTGVGKTELAKAVSEIYFNGESNIVRLDLNEFVMPNDVSRLIATGAENSMSLTAQISKHPFSVVLLDEIEKAHPLVLTTLLQLLDEGILRDSDNNEISFRDAIIIATSNAAANEIREHIENGDMLGNFKDQIINNLILNNEFKPEFLNRFDEICLFKPLSKDDLLGILDLILKSINRNLNNEKISISLDSGAKNLLIERGYDSKMGARPMKRIVQKTVENIVAKAILNNIIKPGSDLLITEDMIIEELE